MGSDAFMIMGYHSVLAYYEKEKKTKKQKQKTKQKQKVNQ